MSGVADSGDGARRAGARDAEGGPARGASGGPGVPRREEDRIPIMDVKTAVSVVIPCFNEATSVAGVLRAIEDVLALAAIPHEIVVVDDGSSDGTAGAAEGAGCARVIRHRTNRGYGAALKTGIREARHDRIVICDADGSYPVAAIPSLARALDQDDMAVGSRTGGRQEGPWMRAPARWVLRVLAQALTGTAIQDLNSGMRAMRRDLVTRFLGILPDGFSFTSTITIAALADGFRVSFHPIDYLKRSGRSKIRPVHDMLGFLVLIVRTALYFNPIKIFLPIAMVFGGLFVASAAWDIVVERGLTDKTTLLFVAASVATLFTFLADLIRAQRRLGR